MRHDYDLPADYQRKVREGEMSEWYERERVKRRALSQDTSWKRNVQALAERQQRRARARDDTTDVER